MNTITNHTITDALGRTVSYAQTPKTVVSLVPSLTELLFDLNIEVIGRTRFCKYPEEKIKNVNIIGGTKDIDLEKIINLNPDLVLANKEENDKKQVLELANDCPVFVSDIKTYEDALDFILELGIIFDRKKESETIVKDIILSFSKLQNETITRKKAIYLIWQQPYMTINKHTFIHSMLELIGFENVFADKEKEYPALTEAEIAESGADIVLLSTEPYHFKEKHIAVLKQLLPKAVFKIIDSELITWYGSRMLKSGNYLHSLQNELLK
jgi:ABC-type Fe3+-hydroxamate transport system substrate-binding protein